MNCYGFYETTTHALMCYHKSKPVLLLLSGRKEVWNCLVNTAATMSSFCAHRRMHTVGVRIRKDGGTEAIVRPVCQSCGFQRADRVYRSRFREPPPLHPESLSFLRFPERTKICLVCLGYRVKKRFLFYFYLKCKELVP